MGYFQPFASLGALREEKRYSVIANNLSNSQTVGFKKDALVFRRLIDQKTDPSLRENTGRTVISLEQGELQKTGNPLDVAIDGPGFFKVKTPYGVRYTRAGRFELNQDQVLVDGNGFPVLGKGGEVTAGGKDIAIGRDGSIQVGGSTVDQLAVVSVPDPALLKKEGQSLIKSEIPQDEIEESEAQVVQGSLESSNVRPVEEMMLMLNSLRAYESCMKLIQSNDELNGKVVNEVGRV
jgi:flagellar basal-body rod protein FlgF